MSEPLSYRKPTIRDTASVTVSSPVDGTSSRRRRGAVAHGPRRLRVVTDYDVKVRDDVWAEVQAIVLDTQRIVIVSATEVMLVNR